jgi:hypothetical protein
MKDMTYRIKVYMKEELHWIMETAAYKWEHREMIQWALNSSLEWARLCTENHGRHSEQL